MPRRSDERGFTLVEVLVVSLIVGVLASMVVPSANRVLKATRERIEAVEYDACMANCAMTKQLYADFLMAMGVEHSDEMFREFLYRLDRYSRCAQGGTYFWYKGDVHCDTHERIADSEDQCEIVRTAVRREYGEFLGRWDVSHGDALFEQFMMSYWEGNSCPEHGYFAYRNGEVHCSLHGEPALVDPTPPEDVPFL